MFINKRCDSNGDNKRKQNKNNLNYSNNHHIPSYNNAYFYITTLTYIRLYIFFILPNPLHPLCSILFFLIVIFSNIRSVRFFLVLVFLYVLFFTLLPNFHSSFWRTFENTSAVSKTSSHALWFLFGWHNMVKNVVEVDTNWPGNLNVPYNQRI